MRIFILVIISVYAMSVLSDTALAAVKIRGLGNSFQRLTKDKQLIIGYYGGSITEGAGASDGNKTSWRGLTTQWFKDQYPQAKITEVQASIGGTGSRLGAFRIEDDLIKHKPDLIFVEYAVNDGGDDEKSITRNMEGIVRHIWRNNPRADIVFVYTTTKSLAGAYEQGALPNAIIFDHKIAEFYGIPEVNVGKTLFDALKGDVTWQTLTIDTVHPNDTGYKIYGDQVAAFLQKHRKDRQSGTMKLPLPYTPNPIEYGRLVDAWTIDAPGWVKEDQSLGGRYPHRITSDKPGTELIYKFEGTAIGIYWNMGPDSGDIEWSLDGGPSRKTSSWDIFAKDYHRANSVIFADDLVKGPHTLKLKVLPDHQPESKGTVIRIGAFLVQ